MSKKKKKIRKKKRIKKPPPPTPIVYWSMMVISPVIAAFIGYGIYKLGTSSSPDFKSLSVLMFFFGTEVILEALGGKSNARRTLVIICFFIGLLINDY